MARLKKKASSSKKKNTVRRSVKKEIDVPMTADSTESYAKFERNEPKMAAYLGYLDVGEYRKFRFAAPVLDWYSVFHRYCRGGRTRTALQLLRDLENTTQSYGTDKEELIGKYPIVSTNKDRATRAQNTLNTDYIYAGVLFHLAKEIEALPALTPGDLIARQRTSLNKFEEVHLAAEQHIPDFDISSIKYPVLGPLQHLREDPMERYSRVNALLKSLQNISAPSKWKATFVNVQGDPYKSSEITTDVWPTWMQPVTEDTSRPAGPLTQPPRPALLPKSFCMSLDRTSKSKFEQNLNKHVDQHIEYHSHRLPDSITEPDRDPRVYPTGEMWRDTLRRQYNFATLFVDFLVITVTADASKQQLVVYDFVNMSATAWTDVLALLNDPNEPSYTFSYTLRALEIDDDDDYEYEYDGPPLAISYDIEITQDHDAVERQLPLQNNQSNEADMSSRDEETREAVTEQEGLRDRMTTFLNTGGSVVEKKAATPESLFNPSQRAEMLDYHDGYDVFTADGLLKWQHYVLDKVCGQMPKALKDKSLLKLDRKVREELQQAQTDSELAALSADPETVGSLRRFFNVQNAFTGTNLQTGPLVDPCKLVLGMRNHSRHGQAKILDLSTCSLLPGCSVTFLDSQVNGAAFMLQRTCGTIPLAPAMADNVEAAQAAKKLTSIKTYGGIIVDTMGFGKTFTGLFFLNYYALYASHTGLNGVPSHKPSLCVTPSGIVLDQWQQAIHDRFPGLQLIIAHGDKPMNSKYSTCWVSATAMREAPAKLDNWPQHLRYIFNPSDSRASKAVILSSYETWAFRTQTTTIEKREGKKDRKIHDSRWSGILKVVLLDEGHKLRHIETKVYAGIKGLNAEIHWFLTATPVVNESLDILGILSILWPRALQELLDDPAAAKWLEEYAKNSYRDFDMVQALPPADKRRLILMTPRRIEALLLTEDVEAISKYYHFMDELLMIRRSTASTLSRNEQGELISLRSIMPIHEVKTVELSYTDEEAAEAQWVHRVHSRDYLKVMRDWSVKKAEGTGVGTDALRSTERSSSNFPPVTAPLRHLTIAAASVLLDRFDRTLRRMNMTTLVDDMNTLRGKGFNAHHFLEVVKRKGDPETSTGLEKLRFLSYGSPTLRYILYQIHTYVLPHTSTGKPRKLLITEDVPIVANFWEIIINLPYIQAEVLHGGLAEADRIKLVQKFNDENSGLLVLIIMYQVSAQGVNLDRCCNRVLVATAAINAPSEMQGWGRVIRVSQKEPVLVIRVLTLNSHDQYRESKQLDKAILDLATRAFSADVQKLLVELLNEANQQVRDAHESVKGRELLQGLKTRQDDEDETGTSAIEHAETQQSASGTRTRKQPVRLAERVLEDPLYTTYGKGKGRASSDSEESSDESGEDPNDEEYVDEQGEAETNSEVSSESSEDEARKDIVLESKTTKKLRREFAQKTTKEQEEYNQDEMNLRLLLKLSPDHIYTTADLKNAETLDRALRLLYLARFGQARQYLRISPHITYNKLPPKVAQAIRQKLKIEEEQLQECVELVRSPDLASVTPKKRGHGEIDDGGESSSIRQ